MAGSRRTESLMAAMSPFYQFFTSSIGQRMEEPGVNNFAIGNPHEMPLPAFVNALQKWSTPQNNDWFAYKMSEARSRKAVASSLKEWRGVAFDPDDISMTTGGFSAIRIVMDAIVDPGDEVIFILPPWFFYELIITDVGGTPVRVKIDLDTFDLDLKAIEAAITPRTRAIIINSPNNPTGKIYPPETLRKLGDLLTRASERNGRTIYLFSDEAYSRIVYDGRPFYSPTDFYPHSLLLYTYGKTLLTPGQRIGYIALPPTMPEREAMRLAILVSTVAIGWGFPNALLQHALADLEKLSIDIPHLQEKRDWMVKALTDMGYSVHSPEGTFYLFPRSPLADDWKFVEQLAQRNILCLPGSVTEMPGYFRISLTANDDMIERALPGFEAAIRAV